MNHQSALDHATATSDHALDDEARAPGRRNRSSHLAPPALPVISGLLMRKGGGALLDGADAAVSAAGASGGAVMPADLLGKFQASLGTDLSSVRVHTDSTSNAAATSVGARAFALGNDIHFAAGQYDPSSSSGQHLLAHEVAHTVQQRGGSPRQQNKLAISQASDSFEVEADRAADAMVSGSAFSLGGADVGLARKVNNEQNPAAQDPYAPPAVADESAQAPSAEKLAEARTYYTSLRDQSSGLIKQYDAELLELAKPPPLQSSIFGPDVDAKTRADRKALIEAQKADIVASREVIASGLVLLDSKKPEDQLRGVNRVEAVKTEYVTTEKGINPFIALLTGSGKTSQTRTIEHKTAAGVGTTVTTKDGQAVNTKDGTMEKSTTTTTATEENGKKTTVAKTDKTKYGLGGASKTEENSTTDENGQMGKNTKTVGGTAKDGRAGGTYSSSSAKGTENDGELEKGTTKATSANAGVELKNDSIGADGGVSHTRGAQADALNQASVTTALDGGVTLSIAKTEKGYFATITFKLSVSAGLSTGAGHESKAKDTASATAGIERKVSSVRTISVPLTEAEVEAYKSDFVAAANGSASAKPGLGYVAMLKNKGPDAVEAAFSGNGSETARKEGFGFEQTDTNGTAVNGGASVNTGSGPGVAVAPTLKWGRDKKVRFGHSPKPGAPDTLVVVLEIAVDDTLTGGATASSGAISGGASYSSKSGGGKTLKFEMPNKPELVAELATIDTEESAVAFRNKVSTKSIEEGTRKSEGSSLTGTVGAGPASAGMTRGGSYEETDVRDADGKLIRTELRGANEIEGTASVAGIGVGSRKDTDELKGTVNADGTANMDLDKSTTTKELDSATLGKNLKENPASTVFQLLTLSSAPATKTTTATSHATKMTEKDLALIAAAAEDEARWVKAVGSDGKAMSDWMATRTKIRAAKGDPTKIAKALAEFENSWDSGRSDVIRGTGAGRFHAEWPPELAAERPEFERLADETLKDQVVATYRREGLDKAVAQAGQLNGEIRTMLKKISDKSESIKNPTLLAEMNRVLGVRASEMAYLKTELPKEARRVHNAERTELIKTQEMHGVDTVNKQTHNTPEALKPNECISDQDLYKDPGEEQVAPQLSPEEQRAAQKKELFEKLKPDLDICQTNHVIEGQKLRWVEEQFDDDEDVRDLFPTLNQVKGMWPAWDEAVKRMKALLAGTNLHVPGGVDRGPRKAWWNEINAKLTGSGG